MAENYVKFLGTAGARFVMARQLRSSAGTFLRLKGQSVMLDPGPGTLLRCAKSRPPIDASALDAVILTHAHLDHSGDANALLDAMTAEGPERRGMLFAPQDCLEGDNAVILKYLRSRLEAVHVLKPRQTYSIGPLAFATSVRHDHPVETYGVSFRLDGRTLSFLADTRYFDGLADSYMGSDVLVINVVRRSAGGAPDVAHLTLDDARAIIKRVRPRKAVLTHFGMTMLRARPHELAAQLTSELGTEVICASDGLMLELD